MVKSSWNTLEFMELAERNLSTDQQKPIIIQIDTCVKRLIIKKSKHSQLEIHISPFKTNRGISHDLFLNRSEHNIKIPNVIWSYYCKLSSIFHTFETLVFLYIFFYCLLFLLDGFERVKNWDVINQKTIREMISFSFFSCFLIQISIPFSGDLISWER